MRGEEETVNFEIKKSEERKGKVLDRLNALSEDVNTLTRYLAHLSKKVDDILVITKVQEEKIKDLESRIEALTAREMK